jgi:hypothetical protein
MAIASKAPMAAAVANCTDGVGGSHLRKASATGMNVRNCTTITMSLALPSHMKSWPASASGPSAPKGWASKKNSTSSRLASRPVMPEVNAHSTGPAIRCRTG